MEGAAAQVFSLIHDFYRMENSDQGEQSPEQVPGRVQL